MSLSLRINDLYLENRKIINNEIENKACVDILNLKKNYKTVLINLYCLLLNYVVNK